MNWKSAQTLKDLGELTASWLEGEIPCHPNGYSSPDIETVPLIGTLAQVNRKCFVTFESQPGCSERGYGGFWRQRAAMSGFCDDVTRARMKKLFRDTGILFNPSETIVTTVDNRPHTEFGGQLSSRKVRKYVFPNTGRQAVRDVCSAHQVTLVDPQWGNHSLLWDILEDL